MPPGPRRSVRSLACAVTVLLVVAVLELGLRAAGRVSSRVALLLSPGIPLALPDPRLGERPNPLAPGHDAAGWRNAERPGHVRAVAIGDSQTYGQTVAREEAWPQRLEARSGVRVYNMALGGYGPVQYLLLVEEALRLAPELVLVGFYSGNDLFGGYSAVYGEGREASLRSEDAETLAALARAEAQRPPLIDAWNRTRAARSSRLAAWDALWDPLRQHSRLWGLARASRRAIVSLRSGGAAGAAPGLAATGQSPSGGDPALLLPVGEGPVASVLTPLQRLAVLDPDDVRIAEGLRISLEALGRMHEACASRCALVVVFLPTKELVFQPLVARSPAASSWELVDLLRSEEQTWERTRHHLDERGIAWVDTLPALRAALARGENPYPGDWDGHMNALGNDLVARAIAESAVFRALARPGAQPGPAGSGAP